MTTTALFVSLTIGALATIVCLIGVAAFLFNHIVTEIRKDHNGKSR